MSELNMDDLIDMARKLKQSKMPCGIVMSSRNKHLIEVESRSTFDEADATVLKNKFMGVRVFDFHDVPDEESIAFYDGDKLTEYLQYRQEGKGHQEALAEVYFDKIKEDGVAFKDPLDLINLIDQ